ncbi:MAG TPA: GAF domain-containing sensor histidine kinase [Terriglobales bacterium]|nr:GAF domain-containing sensor histidine kinase [Terriglobales bacterium]
MSPMLPMKEKARALLSELASELRPLLPEITASWRTRMFQEFEFDGRAMAALERLTFGTGFAVFCRADINSFSENLAYFGVRLAKLKIDTRAVARSLEIYQTLAEPYIARIFLARTSEMIAALETFNSAVFVTVSGSYFDVQRSESEVLLSVLDAELSAAGLQSLLEQVLRKTVQKFDASVGVILLLEDDGKLHPRTSVGLEGVIDESFVIPMGEGFTGTIAQTGESAILKDTGRSEGLLNPLVYPKAKALWGVALKAPDKIIGVLVIGFSRPYDWLPTERELLRAIADRSALAIERARITEALRQREEQVVELSGHLLTAQEEERKRISRELHDETGQGLMVIRLYLGMLESALKNRSGKNKVRETLGVVDRTVEGLRRIIARLSPLVLQELGLVAAVRKEAKDLTKSAGVKTRVVVSSEIGRLAPQTETAIYRVVQEALHNVAKHAKASTVTVQITREGDVVCVSVQDDGAGMRDTKFTGRSFGLAGMRERVSSLGGTLTVSSQPGKGTRLQVQVPVTPMLPLPGESRAEGAGFIIAGQKESPSFSPTGTEQARAAGQRGR